MAIQTKLLVFVSFTFLFSMTFAKPLSCNTKDKNNIKIAITNYLSNKKNRSAVPANQFSIFPMRCIHKYALALVHPKKPVTDNAFVYLHKSNKNWQVISMGTYFDEKELRRFPIQLRDYASISKEQILKLQSEETKNPVH